MTQPPSYVATVRKYLAEAGLVTRELSGENHTLSDVLRIAEMMQREAHDPKKGNPL